MGTFYNSPSPSEEPYVKIGDEVIKDQVICIIEAMKMLNEIKSPVDGTIKKILLDNEDLVEYGQVLFEIEES